MDAKTNPRGKTAPAAASASTPRPFTPKSKPGTGKPAPRVFPPAPPAAAAAVDRPARAFQPKTAVAAVGAGAVSSAMGVASGVHVKATAKPQAPYSRTNPTKKPAPPPVVAGGAVRTAEPKTGAVRVRVRQLAVATPEGPHTHAPNATRWRFPPPPARPAVPPDPAVVAALGRAALAAAAASAPKTDAK